MKRRRKRRKIRRIIFMIGIVGMFVIGWFVGHLLDADADGFFPALKLPSLGAEEKIRRFAQKNDLDPNDYPDELVELLDKNPDTEDFVLNYPLKKDKQYDIDLSEYENTYEIPLLFQWDERWGYTEYCGELMGLSGCGPTCLSMVCIYLLNDGTYNPKYIADFAKNEGYAVNGEGSSWLLFSEGAKALGLDVTEIPLDETRVIDNLKVHNLIICSMGPGDFTTTGHFILMTEYKEGKIRIYDPNSKIRSEKLWYFDDIKAQIRNLWVYR